jgi:hypothetical protein
MPRRRRAKSTSAKRKSPMAKVRKPVPRPTRVAESDKAYRREREKEKLRRVAPNQESDC